MTVADGSDKDAAAGLRHTPASPDGGQTRFGVSPLLSVFIHSFIQNYLSWLWCSQWAQTPFRLAKRTDPLSPHLWARSWDTWTSCTRSSTPKTGQIKHWTIFNLSLCLLGGFCHRTAAFTNSVTVTSWYWVHHGGTKHWWGLTVCASRCCDSFTISGYRGNLKGSWKIYLRTGRPWQSAVGV